MRKIATLIPIGLLAFIGSTSTAAGQAGEILTETVFGECIGLAKFPSGYAIPFDVEFAGSGYIWDDSKPERGLFLRLHATDAGGFVKYLMKGETTTGTCLSLGEVAGDL